MSEHTRVHQETWSLLPWLANGRATPAQRERAEAHLRGCARCRAELAREQQLVGAMRLPAAAAPDVEQGLQRLMQRLDRPEPAAPGEVRAAPRGRGWRLAGTRLGIGAVAALGLAELILVGGLALWWLGTPPSGPAADSAPYRTLTQPEPGSADGPRWRVVFHEQRTVQELQALLRAQGLTVVAGPSEAGVFTLAAEAAPRGAREADAIAARLRQSPLVRFAEAVPARGQP